jgi:hypothetical protein
MSVSLYGSGNTVIQVVSNTVQSGGTPYFSTSSSSLIATGLSVTITPQSTTSKIFILCQAPCYSSATGGFSIYRGSTNLATGTAPSVLAEVYTTYGNLGITIIDSPSTTSSLTYQLYACASSSIQVGSVPGIIASTALSITAFEISGS